MVNPKRIRKLNNFELKKGPIVYWMSRDQRLTDNWALLYAQELAIQVRQPLLVIFCLTPKFLDATIRQYGFMIKGLIEIEKEAEEKGLGFIILPGYPNKEIPEFIEKYNVGALVSDFFPLNVNREWKGKINRRARIPFFEIDAHNIVPCWIASPKQEFGAYTLRPKIKRLLPVFLENFPKLNRYPIKLATQLKRVNLQSLIKTLKVDKSPGEVDWIAPGQKSAAKSLRNFIESKLEKYDSNRNDPNLEGQSDLSPYLHFGQLSPQRVAIEVDKSAVSGRFKEVFLEELIVRRELSDNFCLYNYKYDSFSSLPKWAKDTLNLHRSDQRDYLYKLQQFECAETHDQLWNAAQKEMVSKGKMHGYMRMYWAKKILEWTNSPEEAMEIAIHLNDKYELDGRDPNGYAGIAWSVGGLHDRAWGSRPIFGKIRYMNYKGCKSKFDVDKYISKINKY